MIREFYIMSTTRNTSSHECTKHGAFATICGPAAAGFAENLIFYPAEKVARVLEANKQPLNSAGGGVRGMFGNFFRVVMGGASPVTPLACVMNLYSGFGVAVGYRVLQRGFKYGGQPIIKSVLEDWVGQAYTNLFGQQWGRIMLDGSAGALLGTCEAPLLLPLDALKVRLQINKQSVVNSGSLVKFMLNEGWGLYKGLGWTMTRNAIGSTSFFTSYAMTREYLTHNNASSTLTTAQKLTASTIATMISITLSHPLDVIKTRLQSGHEAKDATGLRIAAEMIQREGLFSLWKGYLVKIPTAGPRVIFTYALAQTLTEALTEWATPKILPACPDESVEEAPKPSSLMKNKNSF